MRPETSLRLLCWSLIAIAALAVFGRLSHGAPIPTQFGGYWPPAARSNCLLTYRADKSFACDRVFALEVQLSDYLEFRGRCQELEQGCG